MLPREFQPITLAQKRLVARDILEIEFTKPAGFLFQAGQFVQFKIPSATGQALRSFSIASAPGEPRLLFAVKVLPTGVASNLFCTLPIGAPVEISAALGAFQCRLGHSSHKVFIATATGLAPVRAMIADRLATGERLELLFGVRSEADIFWREVLDGWAADYPNFFYQLTLSQGGPAWTGARGRVTAHLAFHLFPEAEYYVCGSLQLVKDAISLLNTANIVNAKIHFEIF